jgi:hypothetical protein
MVVAKRSGRSFKVDGLNAKEKDAIRQIKISLRKKRQGRREKQVPQLFFVSTLFNGTEQKVGVEFSFAFLHRS